MARNPYTCEHPHMRIPSACGLSGFVHTDGRRVSGEAIVQSMRPLRERSNGLGGGFAGYGIYPDFADCYALHLMLDATGARRDVELYLEDRAQIMRAEEMPTRPTPAVHKPPLLWRYFVKAPRQVDDEREHIMRMVMHINRHIDGAFVASSGQNMGVFKGVGYPEDIAYFYRLEEYEGYIWLGHGRFPTNTPGWWGGAHPFALLNISVVHNGELSSYDANRRFLESQGYACTLMTDTEVFAYALDFLMRRHGFSITVVDHIFSPLLWEETERQPAEQREVLMALRQTYAGLLMNGPFAIIVGHSRGIVGMNDRIKLRPLVAGAADGVVYIASEEAAIRALCPKLERGWRPQVGRPVIANLDPSVNW